MVEFNQNRPTILRHSMQLVGPDGTPTRQFIQLWNQQRALNKTSEEIVAELKALEQNQNELLARRVDGTPGRIAGGGALGAGDIQLDLATTGVSPGSYTNTDLTVDNFGRVTAAANGSGGSSFRGVLVQLDTDQTSVSFPETVEWDSTAYDTDSFWDALQPTRLTVPAGVTHVQLTASVAFKNLSTAGSVFVSIVGFSGATSSDEYSTYTSARSGTTGFSDNVASAVTPVLEVQQNDYFVVSAQASMSGQDRIKAGARTFFAMQAVQGSGPQGPQGPQGPPGGVDTVFGRSGDVTAQSGDYTWPQIGGRPVEFTSALETWWDATDVLTWDDGDEIAWDGYL